MCEFDCELESEEYSSEEIIGVSVDVDCSKTNECADANFNQLNIWISFVTPISCLGK